MSADIRIDPATGESVKIKDGVPYHRPDTGLRDIAVMLCVVAIVLGPLGLAIHFHREDLLDRYFPYFAPLLGVTMGCCVAYSCVKAKAWRSLILLTIAGLGLWLFPTFAVGTLYVLAFLAFLAIAIFALSKWWRVILPLLGCYIVLHFIVKYW
ncbi:MAG: hypothetical protein EBY17_01905 [Acidobacteriia bacterium]|nr:hypothetical protein [Terriglobia bacterium]